MKLLFIATVLHPEYKICYFQTRESFSRELIERINTDLNDIYVMYDKYYGKQEMENMKSLEGSSPANHENTLDNSKDDYFAYLSNDDVVEEDDKEAAAYLSEKLESASIEEFYRCHRKRFPILYDIARDIMVIPAMSAPVESIFSIVGSMITNPRNNLSPPTTKMLAVIINKVTKRLSYVHSDIESGDTNINDDSDVCAENTRGIDDNSDDIMDKYNEDCDSNCFVSESVSVIVHLSFRTTFYISKRIRNFQTFHYNAISFGQTLR